MRLPSRWSRSPSNRKVRARFRRVFLEQLEDRSLLAEITGIAFQDLDDDGLYEPSGGELGISGLTMYLDLNANGRFDGPSEPSSVTDSAGRYSFDQLGPDRYRVGQAPSLDWIQTSPDQQIPTIRNLDITAEDVLYDPSRNKIFASLAGQTKLAVIDPVSGTVQLSVEVGENLGQLALSDDGRWLYVSLLGGAAVRRVDLISGTVGPQFTLGSHPQFGPYHVDDMAVMPGNPDVIAISRRRPGVSPPHGGVAIFENGVQRPFVTPDHTGPNLIAFGDSPGTLFGQDSDFSDGAFYRMSIDASGVRVTDTMGNYSVRDIEYDNGRIYSSTGTVVDPVQLRHLGAFSRSGGGNVVAANPFQDVGYLVTNINFGGYRLEAFDRQSFLPLEKFDFPNLRSTPLQLVRWGDRGLALRTSGGKVTLIEWDPRPATRAVDVSGGLTASGINFGNRPAVEPGSITGQVFEDLDRNGLKAASEPGIPGRVVYLDQNGNGQLDDGERRTQSDADGNYVFAGLQPGSYFVTESVDAGIRQTSPAPQEARVRRLDLTVNDLVYHSSTGKILASVPSEVGLRGNSISAINPATGVIETSTFIGSEPSKLALSDDGQVLYAALDGAGAVRQYQVDNRQAGLQFWLGQERFGAAVFASDLAVMPGNSQVVVAALETKSSLIDERTGIALYQQGVEQDAFNRLTAVGPIEFSTGSLLFSATNSNRLARIGATPTDLNFLEQTATPVNIGSEFEHDSGRLYSTTGKVFDGTTGLSVGSYSASGAVEPDSDQGITYFVSSGVIKAFDQQTGALIRSLTIPGASSLHSTLIRWGEHGLAFDSFTATWLVEWDPRNPGTNRFHTVHVTSGQTVTAKDFGNIAVNAPPFAAADSFTTREDTPLSIAAPGVLGNDVGDAGKSLTLVSHTTPANGTLTANPDGSFTYSPALHFSGTDTFSYLATDGTSQSNSATVTITVTAVSPVITSNGGGAAASISVPENSTAVTDVNATDNAPPSNLIYSVAAGADAARFSIHPTTGVLRFISASNFESPNDVGADNVYEVIVRVSDGNLSDTQTISVTVTNVVELPNITSNGGGPTANVSVPENTVLVTDVNSPEEVGTTLVYSISGGADSLKFSINDATGLLSFVAAPNFENPGDAGGTNIYDVIVQVSNGTRTDTQAIAVVVTDVAEVCSTVVVNTNDAGAGSLREAINCANATTNVDINSDGQIDPDRITFNIPGSGVKTISSVTALPTITEAVTIDGYTQPGAIANTNPVGQNLNTVILVELNGNFQAQHGLALQARSTVRGLAIYRTFGPAIFVQPGADGSVVEGNFLGTDALATVRGQFSGVDIRATGNRIGGTTPAARNLITGDVYGIVLNEPQTTGNLIQGNIIGTADGVTPLGSGTGITIQGARDNTIGGTIPEASNTISQTFAGVEVAGSASGNAILGNSIFGNVGLGIDLELIGVTPNDSGDPDTGSNNLQNFPEIVAATSSGSQLSITYRVPSDLANSAYPLRVEFFKADADGLEGQKFLGFDTYSAVEAGTTKTFVLTSAVTIAIGDPIVATATDSNSNTSEFSPSVGIVKTNHPPIAVNDSGTVSENMALTIPAAGVLANDADTDLDDTKMVVAINGNSADVSKTVTLASGALLKVESDGSYRYDPNGQFEVLAVGVLATDSFTYLMSDRDGATSSATVTITILGENDAPVAEDDRFETVEDTPRIITPAGYLANDADIDGSVLTAAVVDQPGHGNVELRLDGSFVYTPAAGFSGLDKFTYRVSDGLTPSNVATISLNVAAVNHQPVVALSGDVSPSEGQSFVVNGSFSDPDFGESWTARVNYGDGSGDQPLTLSANKAFQLSRAYTDNGTYPVTVSVRDSSGLVGSASFRAIVQNVVPQIVTWSGPQLATRGQLLTYRGSFGDPGTADSETATVDWGDLSGGPATVAKTGGAWQVNATHKYASGGIFQAALTIQDDDGGIATAATTVMVVGARVNGTTFELVGSAQRDNLKLSIKGNAILVNGSLGGTKIAQAFPLAGVQTIVAYLGEGNDTLTVDAKVMFPLLVNAGGGNDVIAAGGGAAVLIGGLGQDQLTGGGKSDLLIAGTTAYDNRPAALATILAEWSSGRPLATRAENLRTGAGPVLGGLNIALKAKETVFDDTAIDKLLGGGDLDWFWCDLKKDKITGRTAAEAVN